MRFRIWLFIFSFLLFFPLFSSASFGQVVINEFSSGTTSDWVELYNKGTETVSLTDYRIRDSGISNEKDLSGDISAGGVLKETFSNYLNNGGDIVKLLKVSGQTEELLEEIPYGVEGGICAPGESGSIGRFPDGNLPYIRFTTSSPGSSNNLSQEDPCPTPTPTPTPTSTPTPTNIPTPTPTSPPAVNDYDKIFISEFMPYPESGDEWVELYNGNNFEVDLYGWYIDDIVDDGSSPKPISGIISPGGYKQFFLSSAYLNNGGDDVRLLNGNQQEKDKKSFDSSIKGKSWAKDNNGNWCQVEPTPNAANSDCPSSGFSPTSTPTLTPAPTAKTNTPTPTPKPTAKLSPTPTANPNNPEVLGEEASESGLFLLGESTTSATLTPEEETKKGPRDFLPIALIGLGAVLIGGAFIPFLPTDKITKIKEKANDIISRA